MRFKAIPPPPASLVTLEETWRAVPLVPETEGTCCERIAGKIDRVDLDEARRWLALLRALDIVEKGAIGYVRVRPYPETDELAMRYRANVFGVNELIDHLDNHGTADIETAFTAIEDVVPPWERHRNPNTWEDAWRERVAHLLAWGELFGIFERADDRFSLAPNLIGS